MFVSVYVNFENLKSEMISVAHLLKEHITASFKEFNKFSTSVNIYSIVLQIALNKLGNFPAYQSVTKSSTT